MKRTVAHPSLRLLTFRARGMLSLSLLLSACAPAYPDGPFARAKRIETLDEVIGGEKAIARDGDFLLENDQLRIAVLGGHDSLGPGLYGGSLVDADLNTPDARFDASRGNDRWVELFPTFNMNVPKADEPARVELVSDGTDGGEAKVRVVAKGEPFLTLLYALWGLVDMPDMWFVHEYIVRPGEPWVNLRSTVTFHEPVEGEEVVGVDMTYPDDNIDVIGAGLERGVIAGDFVLGGGSVDVFGPGIGFDEDGAVFRANEAGQNIFAQPLSFPFLAATAEGVSYGIFPKQGQAFVPLFSASQTAVVSAVAEGQGSGSDRFAPEEAFTYERSFVIGQGDVGSIFDVYLQQRGTAVGKVRGVVVEQGTELPVSGIDVFVYEPGGTFPISQWRTDVRRDDEVADGSFGGTLPVGDYELLVHRQGRPDPARVPVRVDEGGEVVARLVALRSGVVTYTVRDETGREVPSKLTIFRADPAMKPNRLPDLGDPFHGGDPEWVLFADTGTGEIALPPGRYQAVASRGVEYELDWSEVFEVGEAQAHHLDLQVVRSIDTTGWVSADLHVHAAPSHDSGVTLADRVRTMVCEGVEFFASTDHDAITDYAPVVEAMDLQDWVQTAPGVETTTIEQGHFLAFPLERDFNGLNGGAKNWQGLSPQPIIDSLREQGAEAGTDPLIFIAHPRDGILGYFDQYGFDPFSGDPGAPSFSTSLFYVLAANSTETVNDASLATLDVDAFELFTSKRQDVNRTPTAPELASYATATERDDDATNRGWFERTLEEQAGLTDDVFRLTEDIQGNVDDWFSLLNLGFRHTAIGNSDTHGMTSTEAGCPRNWVLSSTDSPGFIDDQEIADAVREHRVVASYGPFVQLWVDGAPIGSEISTQGEVQIQVEVQAPSWIDVDRIELYENGTLIHVFDAQDPAGGLRISDALAWTPTRDAWYVAIAMGRESMAPVFTPVEIPYIPLDEAVTGALGQLEVFSSPALSGLLTPVPFPKKYAVLPYALTNPIWVDVGGDGWLAPGLPTWLQPAP